jgi:hypothetical protein
MESGSAGSKGVDSDHFVLCPSPVVCVKGRRWSLGLLGCAGVGFLELPSLPDIVGFEWMWCVCCGLQLGVAGEVV